MVNDNLIQFEAAELGEVDRSLGREWLLTNGLGGYASASVLGANTRRYHGLLVAAVNPPVQRTVLLSKSDEEIALDGTIYKLGVNEWQGGTIDPHGYEYLEQFSFDGTSVEFRYALPGCHLIKTICMPYGLNAVYLNYRLEGTPEGGRAGLTVRPFLCSKDYHDEQHGQADWRWLVEQWNGAFSYRASQNAPTLCMTGDSVGRWQAEWVGLGYWNYYHRAEAERGLDCTEDLFAAHVFRTTIKPGESATMVWWLAGEAATLPVPERNFSVVRAAAQTRLNQLRQAGGFEQRDQVSQLLFNATDQFVVARPSVRAVLPPDVPDRSAIAGYHWFSDWGRDTMIALPGLMLTTGRYVEAAGMLRTFAAYLDKGMLPNRFPDSGEEPEYNTVDATLWLFQAVYAYYEATADQTLITELYPKLAEVVKWHEIGTRYGIQVDPEDGLLRAGVPGVQLTWMDAKVDDWVVTPRIGKPVEINALWCNALNVMAYFAAELKRPEAESQSYQALAEQVQTSFHAKFWYEEGEHLFDVIESADPPGQYVDKAGHDCSLRPNQLFALSLPFGPFVETAVQSSKFKVQSSENADEIPIVNRQSSIVNRSRAEAILDVCAKSLLTPYGLRSLSPNDLRYIGRFTGGRKERDGAYHQGTVWTWLIGPFVEAHYRIYGDKATARAFLEPLIEQLREGSVGSLNEVYDGDPPHRPLGCIAQAWSVAEMLRLWVMFS